MNWRAYAPGRRGGRRLRQEAVEGFLDGIWSGRQQGLPTNRALVDFDTAVALYVELIEPMQLGGVDLGGWIRSIEMGNGSILGVRLKADWGGLAA